jgi:diguanylate cyclase (GGDEF)-like protein
VVAIDSDTHLLRARRTAASTRAVLGLTGIGLILAHPSLLAHPQLGVEGFAVIAFTAWVQLSTSRPSSFRPSWLKVEESFAGIAALLIVGLEDQRVTILSILWLGAVTSGVMARGGRVHWIGRTIVLGALVLPVLRQGALTADHAALFVASVGLLLTSGRLTRELNHLLSQARYDADHDDLTGILSRTAFRGALEEATAASCTSAPVSLLLLDLDDFGMVNKTLGHASGDALLASVGERLRSLEGPDCKSGRLGGDEFALIVPGSDPLPLAERLLETLQQHQSQSRRISACVGIAQTPRDGSDAESLLRAGDIALRVAKRLGTGGRVSSYAGESLSGRGEQSARHTLSRLIEGEGISMVVQPIVDLRSGTVHAYEALARFGMGATSSPLHWFSMAQEFGERDALERACLRAALELFSRRPPGVRLSVNLSAPVLLDHRTLRMLEEPHDLSGLIIEVTEEALVKSDTQLRSAIAPLRARGARLAVDDMGAGYSGLRQVITVHPSYLKLDRSLVSGIDHDADRAALVGALVGYADHVGSLLVAEGIESRAELQALLQLGVPLAQGFFLGRPSTPWPGVELEALSREPSFSEAPSSGTSSSGPAPREKGASRTPLLPA